MDETFTVDITALEVMDIIDSNYKRMVESSLKGAKQAKKDTSCDLDTVKINNYLHVEKAKKELCVDSYDMGV